MNSPGSILHIILILHALDLQAIQGRPLFYGETNMNGREGGGGISFCSTFTIFYNTKTLTECCPANKKVL